MFELDVRSRKAIYEQLVDKIKEMIVYGVLQPDEQLPSVRTLSGQLTVNPNTIQKAYRELEREGYIYSLQGKGSFVSSSVEHPNAAMRDEIRAALVKLIAEASYSGLSKADMKLLFEEAMARIEKGEPHD
ncbi:GntR family transcriptional regulator [Paenibacillus taichungensis]|uniref:GntR family transcriptional regulator n=1 Tax=Paenibacillus taichungensis TaxID=484184 RepID=A0ABX2MVK0_9BACL|nr:GntR family transcriptional regulator [Paenibacillus taichungensis]MEC0106469.1 GntR family transcriptional regulator [Paenibacillus taichungensis]MEC0198391.1 GntR family transcriptional regulator [Paenibacillus taichungensis]NUU58071.1 GntR family transcriptional regulator [Paenibacillus taichungensis]